MTKIIIALILCFSIGICSAQEVIRLPIEISDPSIEWNTPERSFFSSVWFTQVVTNVSQPTLTVFRPDPAKVNGTAVIICPGGGLYAHSINSEGNHVAHWLTEKGVTAFVLKYRLVPTGEDGTAEISQEDGKVVMEKAGKLLPLATADALNAIKYVRDNAGIYGIKTDRIGLIGFSAGGAVTMSATYNYTSKSRPDFVVPVYTWTDVLKPSAPPRDAPPMFAICASDDALDLAPGSVQLYSDWIKAGKSAELHMYAQGGHGFGMRKQNLPSDSWIDRLGEWMESRGLMDE